MAGTKTPKDVFETAMSLIDSLSQAGVADVSDNSDYKNRTLPILNVLQIDLYPFSDQHSVATSGVRPVPSPITSFDYIMTDLDDALASGVMPYGLAGHLLLGEGDERGNFYIATYNELKRQFANTPTEFSPIEDVYGIRDYSV